MAFESEFRVPFQAVDAAGIVFYSRVFEFAHECYEQFLAPTEDEWSRWFQSLDIAMPIASARADYRRPLQGGHRYQITLSCPDLREKSFATQYNISSQGTTHAQVDLVHVCIDPKSMSKVDIPSDLRERLAGL